MCTHEFEIKHEYEPLMCTHEFEIKHASKRVYHQNATWKHMQFRIQPKNQQSHGFISISSSNQCKKLS